MAARDELVEETSTLTERRMNSLSEPNLPNLKKNKTVSAPSISNGYFVLLKLLDAALVSRISIYEHELVNGLKNRSESEHLRIEA